MIHKQEIKDNEHMETILMVGIAEGVGGECYNLTRHFSIGIKSNCTPSEFVS